MVKDLEYRPGRVFKGGRAGRWHHAMSLRDVWHLPDVRWCGLHHGPGNHCLQMMLPVPCTLTTSRVSITKAGGLSDALGAERSPNGKDGDTVTYVWVYLFFWVVISSFQSETPSAFDWWPCNTWEIIRNTWNNWLKCSFPLNFCHSFYRKSEVKIFRALDRCI